MSFYSHFANRNRNIFGEKIKKDFAKKIFKLAITSSERPISVLEVGPGDGYIASLAKNHNFNYTGIEGSTHICNLLSKKGYNIIPQMVPPLPEDIGTFDICFLLHVIEHLNSISEASQLITQIKNKLNKDGKIIVATPDYLKWKTDFYNCDYSHNLPFTLKRLFQLFVNEGLLIESAGYYVANQFGLLRIPIYWLGKLFYIRSLDNFMKNAIKSDLWYRIFLTCLPNIVMIVKNKS